MSEQSCGACSAKAAICEVQRWA